MRIFDAANAVERHGREAAPKRRAKFLTTLKTHDRTHFPAEWETPDA